MEEDICHVNVQVHQEFQSLEKSIYSMKHGLLCNYYAF